MKEAVKKGMSLSEIKAKINQKFIDSPTKDEIWEDTNPRRLDKIDYLESIFKRKKLLAPETRQGVYQLLDGLYAQEARSLRWSYVKNGFTVTDIYKLDHASDEIDKRGRIAEEMGDYQKAIRFYTEAERLNTRAQDKGSQSWTPVHSKEDIEALKRKYGVKTVFDRLREMVYRTKPSEPDSSDLATKLTVIAIIGTLSGIFLLSSNMTGHAFGSISTQSTSFIGTSLLIVGFVSLMLGLFWVKTRK